MSIIANAQEMKWWNPQNSTINAIEGQAWQGEHEGFYDRLPTRAKSIVRPEVWARLNFPSWTDNSIQNKLPNNTDTI